jgi:hypothetical protein
VPRPIGARLLRDCLGAERVARWQYGIGFREKITEWQPGRRIGWTFDFGGSRGWHFTDRHLRPDSDYFRVTSVGYTLAPLGSEPDTHHARHALRDPHAGKWLFGLVGQAVPRRCRE